jgi:predicted SnoaL-like aldol condensation-catalyzing enzyme
MNRAFLPSFALLLATVAGCSSISQTQPVRASKCQSSESANRQVVLDFYREALINQKPRAAFDRYVADSFVEHKPDIPGGTKDATAAFLEELINEMPAPKWEIVRTIAENDLVFLHARFTPADGADAYAIADVFRLKSCMIVEHWDVVAGPPKVSRNPHSRF